jgi:hypothetical protein
VVSVPAISHSVCIKAVCCRFRLNNFTSMEIAEDLSAGGARATYEYPPKILPHNPLATPFTSPHCPLAPHPRVRLPAPWQISTYVGRCGWGAIGSRSQSHLPSVQRGDQLPSGASWRRASWPDPGSSEAIISNATRASVKTVTLLSRCFQHPRDGWASTYASLPPAAELCGSLAFYYWTGALLKYLFCRLSCRITALAHASLVGSPLHQPIKKRNNWKFSFSYISHVHVFRRRGGATRLQ